MVFILIYMYMSHSSLKTKIENRFYGELELNYKIYKEAFKFIPQLKSFTIKNKDFIDNSELVDQLAKSTPFIVDKKDKKINKDDLSYTFFEQNREYNDKIRKKIDLLDDKEYFIAKETPNILSLFGRVYDKGYIFIEKYNNEKNDILAKINNFMVELLFFFTINLIAFFYFLYSIKNSKRVLQQAEQEFDYLRSDVQKLALEDTLTKAGTRLKFDEALRGLINIASRFEHNYFGVIMLDIDNFKHVNDTFGHDYGDYVLKTLSSVVQENIRESDTFARWGGEEFVVLAPMNNLEQTKILAEKLRKNIENIDFHDIGQITCSFGAVVYSQGESDEDIMKRVDKLLYKAKNNGKNRVEV